MECPRIPSALTMAAEQPKTTKRKSLICLKNLQSYLKEYCQSTSIHGFRYLGERRSLIEKLWWAVVLIVSLYFCVGLILNAYHKWERAPVIVSFATAETPVWDIPFPAVTICPQTKSLKSLFNFTHMALLKNNDTVLTGNSKLNKMSKQFEYMSLICSSKLNLFTDSEASPEIDSGSIKFFFDVHPNFNEVAMDCSWLGDNCIPGELFIPVITNEGVCYSFNMLDRRQLFTEHMAKKGYPNVLQPKSEWSMEDGYDIDAGLGAFPRRSLISGSKGGIDLILNTLKIDLDYICGDALQGYKVILHHPGQLPNPKQDYFRVGLDQDVVVSVKPSIMKTSEQLKKYSTDQRNCYLATEKQLMFFKTYDQQDCLFECLANYTFWYCGCVGFYMPPKFLETEVSFKIEYAELEQRRNKSDTSYNMRGCNCLPSCNSLNYDFEVSQTEWDWRKGSRIVWPKNLSDGFHLSHLNIFFKQMQFITSERNELYGHTDFMANCGGLLGLFTGFSLISLAEIIYFATLRFICNCRKYGGFQWSGTIEPTND